ncbi:MAG: tripartite tricarboxylate transporter substrate binding protein [Betaproteobacteria bacterium]|nr:tripartite tricarboxylate transporter substrate binding protein [Betaproteobacteria bacterium]
MWKRIGCAVLVAAAGFGIVDSSAATGAYPSRPIRVIDGFPPGGSASYMARVIGAKITERFGQPVIVDNRPGASSNLGAEIVARANADGYTLMLGVMTPLAVAPSLYPKLGYDLLKDFAFVTWVGIGANVLLAHPSVPVKSVSELVELARSKPKTMHYGSSGVGSIGHLAMELLRMRTGLALTHVPYKGGAPSVVAVVSGEVEIAMASVAAVAPMIQAKKLNALAVTSAKRTSVLPGVPTVAESGVPGFDVTQYFGVLAPAGTPAAVVKFLNAEVRRIVQMDDVKAQFATQALEAAGSTPEEFRASTKAEMEQWARVIKDAKITAD